MSCPVVEPTNDGVVKPDTIDESLVAPVPLLPVPLDPEALEVLISAGKVDCCCCLG